MLKMPDFDKVSEAIRFVAQTEVMPRFNKLSVSDISTKDSPGDLVTIADLKAEEKLTQLLPPLCEDSVIIGEESVFKDETLYDRLKEDKPVFIVDPIDGTTNFTDGKPEIAVVVALAYKGETVAGWLYYPVQNILLCGQKGAGAFMNGRRCRVSRPDDFGLMHGAVGRNVIFDGALKAPPAYWGSAAYNYLLVTTGSADFSVYKTACIKPWDHAAGIMLHAEAGGYAAYADGSPYEPFPERKNLYVAPGKDAWDFLKAHCIHKKMNLI